MITNFFKRKHSENIEDTNISNCIIEDEPAKKKTDVTCQSQLKTVKKWMKELNIDIGYKLKPDSDIVCEIWCEICRKHSKDKSSSVSNRFINFLFKKMLFQNIFHLMLGPISWHSQAMSLQCQMSIQYVLDGTCNI